MLANYLMASRYKNLKFSSISKIKAVLLLLIILCAIPKISSTLFAVVDDESRERSTEDEVQSDKNKSTDNLLVKLQETLSKLKPEIVKSPTIEEKDLSSHSAISKNSLGQDIKTHHLSEVKQDSHESENLKLSNNVSIKKLNDKPIFNKTVKEKIHDLLLNNFPPEKLETQRNDSRIKPQTLNNTFSAENNHTKNDSGDLVRNETVNEKEDGVKTISASTSIPLESSKITSSSSSTDDVPSGGEKSSHTNVIVDNSSRNRSSSRKKLRRKTAASSKARNLTKAPSPLSIFRPESPSFCPSINGTDDQLLIITEGKERDKDRKTVDEGSRDDNASASGFKTSLKTDENDQLETYSQFAERLSAEKKNGASTSTSGTNGQAAKGSKVKSKNYASPDCGAKLISANQEASHSHKIILSNKDEYMLNKCTDKMWAVVELCESIRPQKFDIANFELFSNLPKGVNLFGSHRYTAREWTALGTYEGEQGNRGIQSFHVETEEFFKFIKLEVLSHYGTEFFCPVSLFRIYGLSEFEVIDQLEEPDDLATDDETIEDEKPKDKVGMIPTVISVFSGMMNVIKRGSLPNSWLNERKTESFISLQKNLEISKELCFMADSLNYILAYYYDEYEKLMLNPFLSATFQNSYFCRELANISCSTADINDSLVFDTICNNSYACVMLTPKHVLAMCYMYNPRLLQELSLCANISSPDRVADNSSHALSPAEEKSIAAVTNENLTPAKENQRVSLDHVAEERIHDRGIKEERTNSNVDVNFQSIPIDSKKNIDEAESKSLKKAQHKKEKSNSTKQVNATLTSHEKIKSNVTKKETDGNGNDKPTTPTPSVEGSAPSITTGERVAHSSNKESIVVRLSNKIKALEENMSISSQYLEELSRRYKRQMEEMQSQFNATIQTLNRTAQIAYERDLYHQQYIELLEYKLKNLTSQIKGTDSKADNILSRVIEHHLILLLLEILILCLFFLFCSFKHKNPLATAVRANGYVKNITESILISPDVGRRLSLASPEVEPKIKRMSLGSELEKSGTYENLLITDEKRSRKKRAILKRSTSSHSIKNRSLSSGPLEKIEGKPKRSNVAGVLFGHDHKTGSAVEDVEQEWRLVHKGKPSKKRPDKVSEASSQKENASHYRHLNDGATNKPPLYPLTELSSSVDTGGLVINDSRDIRKLLKLVNTPQLSICDTPPKDRARPIWSTNLHDRSFTKSSGLSQFDAEPLVQFCSTPLPKQLPTTNYVWPSTDAVDAPSGAKELFPVAISSRRNVVDPTVKFKLPHKSKKKKKSRSNKDCEPQVPVKTCSGCF